MAKKISGSVGKGGKNRPEDVQLVQELLNGFTKMAGFKKLDEDGLVAVGSTIREVCTELATMIVGDAEGAEHVITVDVTGARSFEEAHRVLKPGGALIVGFIDKNSPIGQEYEERRSNSKFYRQAKFYPSERVKSMLEDLNFKDLSFIQTLFGKLDEIDTVQASKPGHSEGSFMVVKARKKT